MTYTWGNIRDGWLGGGSLAIGADQAVSAFNRVADLFGDDWVEASRTINGSVSRGLQPTLSIVNLGLMLPVLDQVTTSSVLLRKIREGDTSAWAELFGMYLLCSGKEGISLELEPEVAVGGRIRKPDFRTREGNGPWVYVEVTIASSNSEAQISICASLERLTELIGDCRGSYGLEVFLRREPDDSELAVIENRIKQQYRSSGTAAIELPAGLGVLYWAFEFDRDVVTG